MNDCGGTLCEADVLVKRKRERGLRKAAKGSGFCTRSGRGSQWRTMQERSDAALAVRQLVDEYRSRCLWFLRSDYYPATDEERRQVLGYIERHGDREAFVRVAAIRRWLSPTSSAPSAAS